MLNQFADCLLIFVGRNSYGYIILAQAVNQILYAAIGASVGGQMLIIIFKETIMHTLQILRSARIFRQHTLKQASHPVANEIGISRR